MNGAREDSTPAPLDLQVQILAVEGGDPPLHVVVTTPDEVRRLGMRPEEVADFHASIRALPEHLRRQGLPAGTTRDARGRFGYSILRRSRARSRFAILMDNPGPATPTGAEEAPSTLWLDPNELDVFVAAFDRLVAAARRNGLLPEVAG